MTSENVAEHEAVESAAAVSAKAVDDQLIDELVSRAQAEGLQLTGEGGPAKGLTTGEVQAHLADVYGAEVSRQTISTITDKVLDGMAEWQNRPLDVVYPVVSR